MDWAYLFGQIVAWAFFATIAGAVPLAVVSTLVISSRRDVAARARALRAESDRAHVQWWLAVYRNPIGPCQQQAAADMIRYYAEMNHGIEPCPVSTVRRSA